MARIYISSTYVDLITEREAAAQAIRRLGHLAIAMEDYVATDQRPVDKCLQDVKRCDAYVGIFAWRYGYIPEGYDKSISHLEYETAKNAGIPCLIFLTDQKAKWPVEYVTTGEERIKIDQLRSELKKEYIVSFFKNADELGGLVSAAVSKLKFPPGIPSATLKGKPKLGSIVSKMCNRIPQVNDFMKFFLEKSKKCSKRPQFYFIHGDELEGHESLLVRLMKTCLKDYAKTQWGEEYATICLEEVPWPKEGNLSDRQEYLKMNLIKEYSHVYEVTDITANTVSRLPCFEKRPLVLIKHNIYSSKWDKLNEQLIAWYIKEYWAALECDEHNDIPIFLVFFNIRYIQAKETGLKHMFLKWKSSTKERIREQLQHLLQSADEKCPCQLLKELTPIEKEDVMDWFIRNNLLEQELDRKKIIESIFMENNRPVTSVCWAKLEKELSRIVEECQCQREELII
jgi:hypothetical protein